MVRMSNTTRTDTLLYTHEAAALIGIKPGTLRAWRRDNRGPAGHKRNGRVVYRHRDITAWLAHQEATTTRGGTT